MSRRRLPAHVHTWLVEPLAHDAARAIERLAAADDVRHVAVFPDVHPSGNVCVGVALATTERLYPAAVGNDIGCGMAAIGWDAPAALLDEPRVAAELLATLPRAVPALKRPAATGQIVYRPAAGAGCCASRPAAAGAGCCASRPAAAGACGWAVNDRTGPLDLPNALAADTLSDPHLERLKARDGRWQLGTLGRGNHFVELQSDESDRLWLLVHSGSRGIGQAISRHHAEIASRQAESPRGTRFVSFAVDSAAGQAYLHDVAWAAAYAAENRRQIVRAVVETLRRLLGIEPLADSLRQSVHNHVRHERHDGKDLWVHRKGAQPAADDEWGVIPGSMGTASFHVTGRGHDEALASASHGAGRRQSRGEARRGRRGAALCREMQGVWFDTRLAEQLVDEAPSAYKDIHVVLRAQRDLVRIERRLRPRLVHKGT